MRPPYRERTYDLFDATIVMYQIVGMLYSLIIPIVIILGLLWILAKIIKGFVRSILK